MSWEYARDLSAFTAPPKRSLLARIRLFLSLSLFGALLVAVDAVTPIDALAASAVRGAFSFVAAASLSGARPAADASSLTAPLLSGSAQPGTGTAAAQKGDAPAMVAPQLVLAPSSGPRGASVKLTGVNFPRVKLQVHWDGSPRDMPAVQPNAKGEFSVSVKIPANASGGYHVIMAASSDTANRPPSTTLASVVFSVALAVSPSPANTPSFATATPSSAAPSTSVPTQNPTAPPTLAPAPTASSAPPSTNPPTQAPAATLTPSSPPVATTPPALPTATPSPTPLLYPADPVGFIDVPPSNASVSGTVLVVGWAIDRNATGSGPGVDKVSIYRDGPPGAGAFLGTATYGLSRPDVGTFFGNTRFNNSGWSFSWSVGALSSGPHTLFVAMHSTVTGSTTWVTQTVSVPAPVSTATPTTTTSPPAGGGSVAPARAPSTYTLPAGAVSVSTSAGLSTALQSATPQDIVLASGVYDGSGAFHNNNGHRIYSATLGGAVLRVGLVMGGNFGSGRGLVQGVTFDVTDPAKIFGGGIVHVWGPGGIGSRILDSTFNGHKAIEAGIVVRQPEGVVIQRVKARDFYGYGILLDANIQGLVVATRPLLEDLDVAGVRAAIPGSSNGRAETCIWIGNTSTVRRALIRACGMGLWTGTANTGSLHEDIDIDDVGGSTLGVAIAIEHFTTGTTFQRLRIGPNVGTGINCEWADPDWGGKPGSVDNIVQDSTIASSRAGVYMDEGTTRMTVRRVKFVGQTWAAIGDFKGIGNTYTDNDYSGIASGAVAVSLDHI